MMGMHFEGCDKKHTEHIALVLLVMALGFYRCLKFLLAFGLWQLCWDYARRACPRPLI